MAKKKPAKKSKKAKGIDPRKDFNEPVKRAPRQARLAGMEDPEIAGLESLAEEYAEIRDQRQELTKKEVELKGNVMNVMKSNNKTHYHHAGVTIDIRTEKEKVIVRVKKAGAGSEEETQE